MNQPTYNILKVWTKILLHLTGFEPAVSCFPDGRLSDHGHLDNLENLPNFREVYNLCRCYNFYLYRGLSMILIAV